MRSKRKSGSQKTLEAFREEHDALRARLKDHEIRIHQNEQQSRSFNAEVKGIPITPMEDIVYLTRKLAVAIGILLEDTDRVQTVGNTTAPIIVLWFAHRAKRDFFVGKAKQRLSSKYLGIEPTLPVLVNDHPSPSMKRPFGKTNASNDEHG